MSQEIQLDQDQKLLCTENSDGTLDQGRKITLAEFITAAYGLDPCKLYYNRFGRLSPLPPQVQEVYMRLAKRMQITSKDTFGCTVLFGDEECSNIREENIAKECKFHVRAYLKECENLSINPSQGYITRRLSRLNIYSSKEHLYILIWMTIIPAFVIILLNSCVYIFDNSQPNPLDSAVPYILACFALALILYLPLWEFAADILENPLKKHKFRYTADINEVRLKITKLLSAHSFCNKLCETILTLANDKLKIEDCREYLIAELEKATSDLDKLQSNYDKLSIENKSLLSEFKSTKEENTKLTNSNQEVVTTNSTLSNALTKLQSEHNALLEQKRLLSEKSKSIEKENKKLTSTIQTITDENHKLTESNRELTSKNLTLSNVLKKLQTEHNALLEQKRLLSEKSKSIEKENKKLTSTIQTITDENHKLTESNRELTSKNLTLSNVLKKLQTQHNDLLEQNKLLVENSESIEEENNNLKNSIKTLINKELELANQKEELESKVSQLEKEKPDIPSLEKSKKLNLYLIMLTCELLVGNHIPAELQGIKGTKNALTRIGNFFDSLKKEYPEHFESFSRTSWLYRYQNLINFCFEKSKFDPRIIHRSYDGSYEPIEKVIDKL